MSSASDDSFALHVLRPFHNELQNRLQPQLLVPWLYEKEIISDAEKEKIQSGCTRWEQAMYLLDAMKTRSRADAILFVRKLSKTKGIQDLGDRILSKAGEGLDNMILQRVQCFRGLLNAMHWQFTKC